MPGLIDRTTARSYLVVRSGFLPDRLRKLLGWGEWLGLVGEEGDSSGDLRIGPIPPGTPVGLLANLDLRPDDEALPARIGRDRKVLKLALELKRGLRKLGKDATDEQAAEVLRPLAPRLMELSKCPDYVVNRGHYFGTDAFGEEPGLADGDKLALIEFLKTF